MLHILRNFFKSVATARYAARKYEELLAAGLPADDAADSVFEDHYVEHNVVPKRSGDGKAVVRDPLIVAPRPLHV